MDQDDLEDEVLTKTLLAHLEVFSTSFRPLYEWQKRNIQLEFLYALAIVISLVLCLAKKKGLISFLDGASILNEESCEQKLADAAVFALKGQYPT